MSWWPPWPMCSMPDGRITRRAFLAGAGALAVSRVARAQTPVASPVATGRYPLVRVGVARLTDDLETTDLRGMDARWLASLTYDSPFRWNAQNTVIPGAAGYAGRTRSREFTLAPRPDAFFSDGARLTARTIAETIEALRDTSFAWRLQYLDRLTVDDDDRLTVTLSSADVCMPATLTHPALALRSTAGLGTGPFVRESATSWTRNTRFWQFGRPRIDRLEVIEFPDDVQRSMAIATGEIDILPNVPLLDVPMLLHEPTVYLVGGPSNQLCHLQLNLNVPELRDVRVRRVLTAAIDRSRLVQVAAANQAEPASTLFGPGVWTSDVDEVGRLSHAEVRERLQQLGVPSDLRLHLLADNADATLANTAVVLQEQLANCGISLSITLLEGSELRAAETTGDFDLYARYADVWRDPHELAWPLLATDGPFNWGGYSRAEVDLLLDAATSVSDPAFRRARYSRLESLVQRDVPVIPLFRPYVWDAVSTRLPGYQALPPATSRGLMTLNPAE